MPVSSCSGNTQTPGPAGTNVQGKQIAIQKRHRPEQGMMGKRSGQLPPEHREPRPGHPAAGAGDPEQPLKHTGQMP